MVVIDDVKDSKLRDILQELNYTGWYLILYNIKRGRIVLGGYYDNYYEFEEMNFANADAGFIIFERDENALWDAKFKTKGKSLSSYTISLLGEVSTYLEKLGDRTSLYITYKKELTSTYVAYRKMKHDAKINRKRLKKGE